MLPILFKIGPIPIHSYGLMIAIGFLTAIYLVQRDAVKAGLDPKVFADGAFWVLPLGIAGTRLLHIVMFPEGYSWGDPLGWIAVWRGGLVFQGGPPVAIVFIWFYLKKKNVSFWKASDIVVPYLAMAHGLGRVGCFLNGCCYGAPSDLPWAFPYRRVPWDISLPATGSPAYLDHLRRFPDMTPMDHWSHAIHPTQLYGVVGLLMLCGILLYLRKHWNPFDGFLLPTYFVIYGIGRFVVEFFRGDHNPTHVLDLSDQQIFSVAFALGSVVLFAIMRRYLPRNPRPSDAIT